MYFFNYRGKIKDKKKLSQTAFQKQNIEIWPDQVRKNTRKTTMKREISCRMRKNCFRINFWTSIFEQNIVHRILINLILLKLLLMSYVPIQQSSLSPILLEPISTSQSLISFEQMSFLQNANLNQTCRGRRFE